MTYDNLGVEQSLLGLILLDNRHYDQVSTIMRPEYFTTEGHDRIYAEISKAIESGVVASPVTIKQSFDNDPIFEKVGGSKYLSDLVSEVPLLNNAKDYAMTIKNSWLRRSVISAITELKTTLDQSADWEDPNQILHKLQEVILSYDCPDDDRFQMSLAQSDIASSMWTERAMRGENTLYKTGINGIDNLIGGLAAGGLYVIAGRTGMGKTVLGLNMAEHLAVSRPVMFFSLEMTADELSMRIKAGRTGISVQAQRSGKVDTNAFRRLAESQDSVTAKNLHINFRAGVPIEYISAVARRFNRKYKNGVFVVDHLGLIKGDKKMNRTHQIESITNTLKAMAKELNAPIILLSQLSRGVEGREDKRPTLSDLRDSGAIEQDADAVLLIYRPEYYLKTPPEKFPKETQETYRNRLLEHEISVDKLRGKAFVYVEKNRQGSTGEVELTFDGVRQKFFDE